MMKNISFFFLCIVLLSTFSCREGQQEITHETTEKVLREYQNKYKDITKDYDTVPFKNKGLTVVLFDTLDTPTIKWKRTWMTAKIFDEALGYGISNFHKVNVDYYLKRNDLAALENITAKYMSERKGYEGKLILPGFDWYFNGEKSLII